MGNKKKLKNFIDSLKENINFSFSISNFNDRLKLQKYVFLAKCFGFEHNYNYSLYIRGPYSSDLANDYYDIYREGTKSDDSLDMDFDSFSVLTKNKDVDWLESASTMLSLYNGLKHRYSKYPDKKKKDVLIKGTKKLKSHICADVISKAFKDLNNFHIFN